MPKWKTLRKQLNAPTPKRKCKPNPDPYTRNEDEYCDCWLCIQTGVQRNTNIWIKDLDESWMK